MDDAEGFGGATVVSTLHKATRADEAGPCRQVVLKLTEYNGADVALLRAGQHRHDRHALP